RDDLRLRVQVVELLAEGQEDLATGEGARERRVEHVGLAVGHPDDERPAVANGGRRPAAGGGACRAGKHEQPERPGDEEGGSDADASHRIRPSVMRGLGSGRTETGTLILDPGASQLDTESGTVGPDGPGDRGTPRPRRQARRTAPGAG